LTAAGIALQAKGQTSEVRWPYDEKLGAGSQPEPATATDAAWYAAETIDTPVVHDGIEAVVEDALASGLPVVLVIELTREFERPNADGQIAVPPLAAPAGDYHAVLAVGAATDETGKRRRLLVRNSWGPGWGAGGYGWLPLEYLIAFGVRAVAIDYTTLAVTAPADRTLSKPGL
jgi:C1A family cysteine protease